MMKKKRHFLIYLLVLSAFLYSCEEINYPENSSHSSAKIHSISSTDFKWGDTLDIHGRGFGNAQNGYYVEFNGDYTDEPAYLVWSDSLIRVVVPEKVSKGWVIIKNDISNHIRHTVVKPWYMTMIDIFVNISLVITLLYVYLRINKIWKRKNDREVAESQSLAGLTIYIINCILWVSYYIFVEPDTKSMLDTSIYIFEGSIFFLIGTGLWVKGQRSAGLWKLIRQSLKLERKEADYLLKRFFKPKHADVIINILHQLAMIDEELDDKEREIISIFAKEWNIDYSVEKLNKERTVGTEGNYIRLRNSVMNYLEQEPPIEQVAQLKDLIDELIKADDKVSAEEELISSELLPLIENYLTSENKIKKYHVIIVPQRPEHDLKIIELVPDSYKVETAGGVAYTMGTFYSYQYADMICRQFRQYNLFTIVHSLEEDKVNPVNQ